MDIFTKLKALKRWQESSNYKKFKCQNDENHELLKPFIKNDEVLMKCINCGKIYKNLNKKVFELGNLLLIRDKKIRRNK